MALKDLSPRPMVQITAAWLDPERERSRLIDPEDAAIYLEIRDQLFADGLKFISASYSDEAGEVKLARDRLTPESKAALKALPTPGGNLLKAVQAWIGVAASAARLS
ncbi:hypothetical protein [Sorangium sp. So ce176]|uniref:hypothetical protein n=1 Tax=Sorangium sp. So ce176 TaxID=3133286 RepID=UPI003F63944C